MALVGTEGVVVEAYEGLGTLPHFNPDLDREGDIALPQVADLRERVSIADGLLICSPEYAHGVPGSLKNALDWLVSSPVIIGKHVALINPSVRAKHAQAALRETLTVMSMNVLEAVIPLDARKSLDAAGIVADDELRGMLSALLEHLSRAIAQNRT
jgi:chromate reductase, NAD(P)H dehydrogenase (quinone)